MLERAEIGIDGNCGFALLGEDLQVGEAEFVEIALPVQASKYLNRYHHSEWATAAKIAATAAYRKLKARLPDRQFSYYLGPSHPDHCWTSTPSWRSKMDEYGFAAAAKAGLRMFEACSRQSGRTMRMIERVTEDDQIVASTEREATRIRQLLKAARKPKVRVHVVDPSRVPMSAGVGTAPHGRTFFEHSWVLQFFERRMEGAERDLEIFQRETSKTWPEKMDADPSADRIFRASW